MTPPDLAHSTRRLVDVEHVLEWLRGDLAWQLLCGPPGEPHNPPLTEVMRLEMLADDFAEGIESTEIPSYPVPAARGLSGCKPERDSRGDVWCWAHRRDYGECQSAQEPSAFDERQKP